MTYMNLSGNSVSAFRQFYKLQESAMLVALDDIALPLGKLRLRAKGSAGGHNGLQSIIDALGTQELPRLRVGIGATPGGETTLVNHVLSRFLPEEEALLEKSLLSAVEAIEHCKTKGFTSTMDHYN